MEQQTQPHHPRTQQPALAHAGYAAAVGEALAPLVEHVTVVVDHGSGAATAVPLLGIVVEVHDGPEPAPGSAYPPAWLRLSWDQISGWRYQFPHEVGQFEPENGHRLMNARVPAPHDLAGWLAVVIEPRSAEWRDAETEPAADAVLPAELAVLVEEGVVTEATAAQLAAYLRPAR